jgi:hypothetical protein
MNDTIQTTITNFIWGIADNDLLNVYERVITGTEFADENLLVLDERSVELDEIAKKATKDRE